MVGMVYIHELYGEMNFQREESLKKALKVAEKRFISQMGFMADMIF